MDPEEEARLLKLYNEVETDDGSSQSSAEETDSDDTDPTYIMESKNGASSEDESNSDDVVSEVEDLLPEGHNATIIENENDWMENFGEIPDFNFHEVSSGIQLDLPENPSAYQVFEKMWSDEVMEKILLCSNEYGEKLTRSSRPHRKHARISTFPVINKKELYKFFALALLRANIGFPVLRKVFSYNPLYYHPIFLATMSGRRFEQILRVLSCSNEYVAEDRLHKVSPLLNILLSNFQKAYKPPEQLSLDESLLLFRGRLSFRQYIKGKRARYGIKFYELCDPNGYILNIEIYKGKQVTDSNDSKINALVLRLLDPYLEKGHHVFMDNYYNSIGLSKKLLRLRTHTTGTLRSNRKGNPKIVTEKKLKRGEYVWVRSENIYISKWKDKRDVLAITTKYHPQLIEVPNRFGQIKTKPKEIGEYNKYMSGVDRCDQLTSYYSSPRKTIRWYKKIIFHLLDVAVLNAFLMLKKKTQRKISFLEFREQLITELLELPGDVTDGRQLVKPGPLHQSRKNENTANRTANVDPVNHFLEKIPAPENWKRKSYFLRCRECFKNGKRSNTSWRCKNCQNKPALCAGTCFENYHNT